MGVAGLWDIIRPAGQQRSLTHLAVVDGFQQNPAGLRGLRIGIDASIWFFHAAYGKEGENPELRTLFFRCTRLMGMPFLPLFVFDGPKRPAVKRGKRIAKDQHWMVNGMKNIIHAFGFACYTAPGEAEAELAYLNNIGIIDAVLSDDVDNFLFGAATVIRNPSNTLSGNRANPTKNAAGKDDGNHVMLYKASDIAAHPGIGLTRGGYILIGLASGGDYNPAGIPKCGPKIALGLARAGLGDRLWQATQTLSDAQLPAFLAGWREELRTELRTDAGGFIGRKNVALAAAVPDDFPDAAVLRSYTNPITSASETARGKPARDAIRWDAEPDLGQIAGLCEQYFEWGVKDIIIKRFRTVLWPSAVLRILRRAALDSDSRGGRPRTPNKTGRAPTPGTPSRMIARRFAARSAVSAAALAADSGSEDEDEDPPDARLIVKIHSARRHASTDSLLEYRLEIAPAQLVRLAAAGVRGTRPPIEDDPAYALTEDEDGEDDGEGAGKRRGKKAPADPDSPLRVWMPACMVEAVDPELVRAFQDGETAKAAKKAGKGAGRAPRAGSAAPTGTKKTKAPAANESEESSGEAAPAPPIARRKTAPARSKTPTVAPTTSSRVAALFDGPLASQSVAAHEAIREEEEEDDDALAALRPSTSRAKPYPFLSGHTTPPGRRTFTRTQSSPPALASPPRRGQDFPDLPTPPRARPFPGLPSPLSHARAASVDDDTPSSPARARPAGVPGFYPAQKPGAAARANGKAPQKRPGQPEPATASQASAGPSRPSPPKRAKPVYIDVSDSSDDEVRAVSPPAPAAVRPPPARKTASAPAPQEKARGASVQRTLSAFAAPARAASSREPCAIPMDLSDSPIDHAPVRRAVRPTASKARTAPTAVPAAPCSPSDRSMRSLSSSPVRPVAPRAESPAPLPARRAAPRASEISIISISSEEEELPPLLLAKRLAAARRAGAVRAAGPAGPTHTDAAPAAPRRAPVTMRARAAVAGRARSAAPPQAERMEGVIDLASP